MAATSRVIECVEVVGEGADRASALAHADQLAASYFGTTAAEMLDRCDVDRNIGRAQPSLFCSGGTVAVWKVSVEYWVWS